jgi:hypothetical protein
VATLVQLGTVPEWVQAAAEAGALFIALRGRWQQQAVDWAKELERLSGMSTEELRLTVEASPELAELVSLAWEEAARTASENKRRLLAKVVAAALRGDSDALVDAAPFLLRTVIALEPAHVTLLVVIATRAAPEARHVPQTPGKGSRPVAASRLTRGWQASEDLLHPALATLEREGLIYSEVDVGEGSWGLRPYGMRFLAFLEEAGEPDGPPAGPA